MIKNFLKITFRNLMRKKVFSSINILGLSIGMASALLILLWVQNELSYDRFYTNTNRLYQMYNRDKFEGEMHSWGITPIPMATALKKDYPEVEDATRFNNITFLVSNGDKRFNLRGAFADSSFLQMFSLPLLHGNAANSLNSNYNIVLTQKLAIKLFGNENAIGKTVLIDSVENFTVSAVLKDLPNNTSFDFEYLLPWAFRKKLGWDNDNWASNDVSTFVLLKPGALQSVFDKKVENITRSHSKETTLVFTQPLSRLHLYSKDDNGKLVGGQIETVRLFIIIAILILLIACINFMNLSTAQSEKRAKEVGIRKTSGAGRRSLIFQFIGESIIIAGIAYLIGLFIVELSLPAFSGLTGKELYIDITSPLFWLFSVAFIFITGLIAGCYPAFYLSSFMPVKVLKGSFKKTNALVTPRKVLVVLQFSFAIILIISTIIVSQQIKFGQNRDTGYDRNSLVYTFVQGDADKNYPIIRQELLSSGAAVSVSRSSNPITQRRADSWGFTWDGSTETDKKTDFVRMGTDAGFVKTMGVELLQGRDIDIYNYPTDSTAILLNESAVKAMHVKNPLGMTVKNFGDMRFHVVGVVKDFILESPFEKKVNPIIVFGPSVDFLQVIHFKLNPLQPASKNIALAESIFKKYNPQIPFEYVFADESYAKKFKAQLQTGNLSALFAGLSIFISCLGLFGLAMYMAESRIKEIGVRKVLGASVTGIASLLSKDFLKLVLIAILIASPIAWFAMNKWLQGYTYRIEIQWWVLVSAGILSVLIAFITVSYQAVKAAMANPVNSLRTE